MERIRRLSFGLIFTLGGCAQWEFPLPELEDVKTVTAIKILDKGTFEVKKEDWEPIWLALKPSYRDRSPAKWTFLGALQIVTTDGQEFHVSLDHVPDEDGAFAAGPS